MIIKSAFLAFLGFILIGCSPENDDDKVAAKEKSSGDGISTKAPEDLTSEKKFDFSPDTSLYTFKESDDRIPLANFEPDVSSILHKISTEINKKKDLETTTEFKQRMSTIRADLSPYKINELYALEISTEAKVPVLKVNSKINFNPDKNELQIKYTSEPFGFCNVNLVKYNSDFPLSCRMNSNVDFAILKSSIFYKKHLKQDNELISVYGGIFAAPTALGWRKFYFYDAIKMSREDYINLKNSSAGIIKSIVVFKFLEEMKNPYEKNDSGDLKFAIESSALPVIPTHIVHINGVNGEIISKKKLQ
jgi:hypothetical protein